MKNRHYNNDENCYNYAAAAADDNNNVMKKKCKEESLFSRVTNLSVSAMSRSRSFLILSRIDTLAATKDLPNS